MRRIRYVLLRVIRPVHYQPTSTIDLHYIPVQSAPQFALKDGKYVEYDRRRGFGADVSTLSSMLFLAQVKCISNALPENFPNRFQISSTASDSTRDWQCDWRARHYRRHRLLGELVLVFRRDCCKPDALHGCLISMSSNSMAGVNGAEMDGQTEKWITVSMKCDMYYVVLIYL